MIRPIDRRLAALEAIAPHRVYDRMTDAELRAATVREFARSDPAHADQLFRASERIAAGEAEWPWFPALDDLENARATHAAMVEIGA